MATGGYIYEQIDLTYDQNTNGATVRSWALAVHKARCKAFIKAAQREYNSFGGNGWHSVRTQLYNEFTETIELETVYIQDIHPTSVDTTEEYPAFVTFFKNAVSSAEYCIITHQGANCISGHADPSTYYAQGLHFDISSVLNAAGSSTDDAIGQSMSHAFAKNGFGSYDVCAVGFITTDCTAIMAAHVKTETDLKYSYMTSDGASLIGARYSSQTSAYLVSKTFQFGFAIKGHHIIALERRSDAPLWLWCIIGEIIGTTIDANDTHKVAGILADYYSNTNEADRNNNFYTTGSYAGMTGNISITRDDGTMWRMDNPSSYVHAECSRDVGHHGMPGTCVRSNTLVPSDIRYNAVAVGVVCNSYDGTITEPGIDSDGNGCKGFIDTDLLRMVGARMCQTVGANFQSGKFVSMKAPQSAMTGYILGWDDSNATIM